MADCNVVIHDVDLADDGMLAFVMQRVVARHAHGARSITINCSPRQDSGWLEYLNVIEYNSGGRLVVGTIQRTVDGEYESHS